MILEKKYSCGFKLKYLYCFRKLFYAPELSVCFVLVEFYLFDVVLNDVISIGSNGACCRMGKGQCVLFIEARKCVILSWKSQACWMLKGLICIQPKLLAPTCGDIAAYLHSKGKGRWVLWNNQATITSKIVSLKWTHTRTNTTTSKKGFANDLLAHRQRRESIALEKKKNRSVQPNPLPCEMIYIKEEEGGACILLPGLLCFCYCLLGLWYSNRDPHLVSLVTKVYNKATQTKYKEEKNEPSLKETQVQFN